MASEKDRWWCKRCQAFVTDRPASKHPNGHILVSVPGSALDAHAAEVISMITTYIAENCATSADTWTVEPSELIDAIRSLAPHKDSARSRASAEEEKT